MHVRPSRSKPPAAPVHEVSCPSDFSHLDSTTGTASCWCDGNYADTMVAIGTGQYHELSDPSAAAIHAGAPGASNAIHVAFISMQQREPMRASYIVVGHGHPGCSQSLNQWPRIADRIATRSW